MLRKGLVALVCLITMTAAWSWAATTWQLQTKLSTTGGYMRLGGKAPQTTAGSIVYNNFTTAASVPAVVTANSGYRIKSISRSGVPVPLMANMTTHYYDSFNKSGGTTQSLLASFAATGSVSTGGNRAWQLQTKLATNGGSLKVQRSDTQAQTVAGIVVYNNYTTRAPVAVKVDALAGYKISSITQNGTAVSIPSGMGTYTVDNVNNLASTTNTLVASFLQSVFSVTLTANSGGTISPSTSVVYGGALSAIVRPATNGIVNNISVTPSGLIYTLTNSSGSAITLPYPGQVTVGLSNIQQSIAVNSEFDPTTASAGVIQYVPLAQPVTLNGSYSGGDSILWEQISGPAVSITGGNSVTPTFIPTVKGTYEFKLTVYSGTTPLANSVTKVVVTDSVVEFMRFKCENCHVSSNLPPKAVFVGWSAARHTAANISCVTCHTDFTMPGPVNSFSVNATSFVINVNDAGPVGTYYCATCHKSGGMAKPYPALGQKHALKICADCHISVHTVTPKLCTDCHTLNQTGNIDNHPVDIAGNACSSCHRSGHNPASSMNTGAHFNNVTSGMYPASYVTSLTNCTSCHYDSLQNIAARSQWAPTGHAATTSLAWIQYDFKTQSGCVQCHTTTGFIAYSSGRMTAAWGTAADKTKQVLACVGCHSDVSTGQLRAVAAVKPFASEPGYTNPDAGKSNTCMACHSGTNNGASIVSGNFAAQGFISPHYMAAGGTLYGKAGYHFPGRTYSDSASHQRIGSTDSSGPCISCHKTAAGGHSFQAQVTTVCDSCHGGSLTNPLLTADKASFLDALEVLRAQLAAKGFIYTGNYPYFVNQDWGTGQAGANTMGAAFNYVMLVKEPGAFAHDPAYAKQLVLHSIDYLDDGLFNDTVEATAAALPLSALIKSSFVSYKNKNSCASCHGFTATSGNLITTNAHDNHLSGTSGLATVFGNTLTACQQCHTYNTATHLNGLVNMASNSCSMCHPGGDPAWNGSAQACTSCHALAASRISGVDAPYKPDFTAEGHGQFGVSSQCTACHNTNARHITGFLGDDTRLLQADNSLCSSCHNDALKVTVASKRNMFTHFTSMGGVATMRCDACHDSHGTSNRSMIRATIKGILVNYTSRSTGWVKADNKGLCQVCHTKTAHYRADGTGTAHFLKDCFQCHKHNSEGGAFYPVGTCDTCHGYPPAPKNTSVAVNFGVENNWTGARFEDYSGGGGAHLVPAHVPKTALPAEGWSNCAVCHNNGDINSTPDHLMVTPVKPNIASITVKMDTKHRFENSLPIYTSAKRIAGANKSGSCFNVNCHMKSSPRWSMER